MQLRWIGNKSIFEFNQEWFKKQDLQQKMESIFKDMQLDAIISPVMPIPPFPHGYFSKIVTSFFYWAIWNFFDYPTAVIPRVHIVSKEDTDSENYKDPNFNDSITRSVKEVLAGSEGLPCGIQVTTMTYQDERCLGVAKQIDNILHKLNIIQEVEIENIQ